MFYKCVKCKNKWQYPILKCPECFSATEKFDGKNIKVAGVSIVSIPTLLHPIVPYFGLILEDDKGNRWAYKSTKEYKIGDDFKIETTAERDAVAIWRIKYDIFEAIEKIIGTIEHFKVAKDFKVLILPTLIIPKHSYLAFNTNPQILDGIINFLLKKGIDSKNIKIAAQSFDEIPIKASASKSGLLDICLKHKIAPFDLAQGEFIKEEKDGFVFEISKEALDSDFILNLPILKMDEKSGIQGATKNIIKLLKKESYLGLKYLYSEDEILIKLNELLKNCFHVGDGLVIQNTNQYTNFLGILFASFNPLNLDRVFAQVVGSKKLPKYLASLDAKKIKTFGRTIEEVKYNFEREWS